MNKQQQIKDIVKEIQRVIICKEETSHKCSFGHCNYCGKCPANICDYNYSLQDLLLVIEKKKIMAEDFWGIQSDGEIFGQEQSAGEPDYKNVKYNMEKSFLENLENDELREFIYQLICK